MRTGIQPDSPEETKRSTAALRARLDAAAKTIPPSRWRATDEQVDSLLAKMRLESQRSAEPYRRREAEEASGTNKSRRRRRSIKGIVASARKAGVVISAIEIDGITLHVAKAGEHAATDQSDNPWDEVLLDKAVH